MADCYMGANGAGKCTQTTLNLGCYNNGLGTCLSDQYYAQCSDGWIDLETGPTWCSFGLTAHKICGPYVENPPPTGGWGCIAPNSCSWVSWGTYSGEASCLANCEEPPPTTPPQTCGGNVCSASQSCCNSASPFCYDPNQVPTPCGNPPTACQPTADICETGVGIPGSSGTGCNSAVISYRNSENKITLAATKTDGSSCGDGWGMTWGDGLAVWKKIEPANSNPPSWLKPNYPQVGSLQEFISKDLHGIIGDGEYKISLPTSSDDPMTSNTYLLNPACTTNSGYGGGGANGTQYDYDYVFNTSTDRNDDSDNTAEKRWKAMAACYSTVDYAPIQCTVTTSASTFAEGESITVNLWGGSRKPISIDGAGKSSGYTTRLFLERTDFREISPLPASLTYTDGQPGNVFNYHIDTADCAFGSATGTCNSSFEISDLPAGAYYFHCDIPAVPVPGQPAGNSFEPQNCSGNPWCSYEGGDPANTCTDWISCSAADNINFVVNQPLPTTPTGLISSCTAGQSGSRLTISWDDMPDADTYFVRVDDGVSGVDNIDAVGYVGADTCGSYPNWDVCITTVGTTIDLIVDPDTFVDADWFIYGVNGTGKSVTPGSGVLQSCIPNCTDLSGPVSVFQGQTADFSANFTSAHGYLGSAVSVGQGGVFNSQTQWNPQSTDCGSTSTSCSKSFAWDTTGVPTGTYDVFCKAWNDGIAECRGDASYVDTPPRYACAGGSGATTMSVEVLPPQLNIIGSVYDGTGGISGNFCAPQAGDTVLTGEPGMQVAVTGLTPTPDPSAISTVGTDGVYTSGVFQPGGVGDAATVTLSGIPAGYSFVCPANGIYPSVSTDSITADIENVHFFISQLKDPWWQTRSGLVYGQNSVTSSLPYVAGSLDPTCLASSTCVPFLITGAIGDLAAEKLSAGIPMSSTGINGTQDYDTEHQNFTAAPHSDSNLAKEGYASLSRRFDLTTATTLADTLNVVPTGATGQGSDGTEVYIRTGNLTIAPSATWNIAGNRKVVIFVDGNILVEANGTDPLITVEPGSFFAVIATGNITFDADIGAPINPGGTPTITPQIEGVFVANGTLTVNAYNTNDVYERMFIGAGSFVGWSGVDLQRDFAIDISGGGANLSGTLNSYVPTDTFVFRPDFILNTPELMKRSTFNWREINSITQD